MTLRTWRADDAPRQLFATTPAQRVALARQQFFEEGVRPSGLVNEAVIQSWMRCRQARPDTAGLVEFDPVSTSRLHATLNRNRELLAAADEDLVSMEASLAGTDCRVLLTDADGVVVHATRDALAARQSILKVAARVGINVSEGLVGTTAPGIVAKTGQASTVHGAEHYFDCLRAFECAAAPIRDISGRLAAVLDLSVESRGFGFDAASMVGLYATSIENRLLRTQSRDMLVLQFQASPGLLGTPLEALAGIAADGRVAWLNGVAARLAGQLPEGAAQDAEAVFGLDLAALSRLARGDAAVPARLPSGLGIWVRANLPAHDGIDWRHAAGPVPSVGGAAAVAGVAGAKGPAGGDTSGHMAAVAGGDAARAPTLDDHSRRLIESTLAACGGNISKAARELGVSRGTLYRRLNDGADGGPLGGAIDEAGRGA